MLNYDWWYKVRALEAYSKGVVCCAHCGLTNIEALTIDHINDNGAAHRRKIGHHATHFYRWLHNNDYPDGFQVLCYNCNSTKHRFELPEHYVFLHSERIKYTEE